MTITQTIDIPADRRITLEVPREVPTGRTIINFTPVKAEVKPRMTEEEEKAIFEKYADELNAEAMDVLSYQVPLWNDEEE